MEKTVVAPQVSKTLDVKYIIRLDKSPIYYSDEEKNALKSIESIAKDMVAKANNPSLNLYTKILSEGKEIQIYSQTKGYLVNGGVHKICTLDIVMIPKVVYENKD